MKSVALNHAKIPLVMKFPEGGSDAETMRGNEIFATDKVQNKMVNRVFGRIGRKH